MENWEDVLKTLVPPWKNWNWIYWFGKTWVFEISVKFSILAWADIGT